jgi:hypothetical protein
MTTLRATAPAYGVQHPEARRTEVCMTNLVMQLSETVCDERGTFHPRAMARERSNGSWEGWLEFVPVAPAERNTSEVALGFPTKAVRGSCRARSALPNKIAVMRVTGPTCEGSIGILTRTRRLGSRRRDATETISKGGLQAD